MVCGGVHLRSLAADPGRRRKRTSTFFQGMVDRFSFIPFGKAWVRPLGSPSFPWVWFLVLRPCCWETSVDGSGLMVGSIDRGCPWVRWGVGRIPHPGWFSPVPDPIHRVLVGPAGSGFDRHPFPFPGFPPTRPTWLGAIQEKGVGMAVGHRPSHPSPSRGGASRRGNHAHERPWRRRNPPIGWDSKRWDWIRSSSKP